MNYFRNNWNNKFFDFAYMKRFSFDKTPKMLK